MKKILFCVFGLLSLSFVFLFNVSFVSAEPYGWSPDVNKSTTGSPVCNGEKPGTPIMYQPNHPALPQPKGSGQVRLQWVKVSGASGYTIYYGLSPKNYIFSVQLPDSSDNYTIGYLANRIYYFAVQAKKDCAVSALSREWGARPNGGGFLTVAAGAVPLQRTTSPSKVVTPTETVAPQVQQPTLPVAPKIVVPAPAPKSQAQPGFFQSILNFFGGLFK